MSRNHWLIIALGVLFLSSIVTAQDTSPVQTGEQVIEAPENAPAQNQVAAPLAVYQTEPAILPYGETRTVSLFGANFTDQTTVRLVGVGLLKVTFVNATALMVEVPTVAPATYAIEVTDLVNGTAIAPTPLTILPPPPTAAPTATPITPVPTLDPPTPMPGKPMLVTRNFSTSAASIAPGNPVTLTFEVVNMGNRTAQGVSVSLAAGSKFAPANGQSAATLADIVPNGAAVVTLSVVAAVDTPAGANSVPMTITYHDFSGESYTATAALSVTVSEKPVQVAQVVLSRYRLQPATAQAGQAVTATFLLTNTGSETAKNVLVKLGKDGFMLAGANGDSIAAGDIAPNASVAVDLPLIIAQGTKAGVLSQPLVIAYMTSSNTQGTVLEVNTAFSMQIAAAALNTPLLLLDSYSVGDDETLNPGERFGLTFTLTNVGTVDTTNMLVTFGTVESSSPNPPPTNENGGNGSSGGTGGSTTTSSTPSNLFAPLGGGGTLYIETLKANDDLTLTQEFIVNGTTKSGIYALPITLNYRDTNGASAQTTVNASLIVVALPRIQVNPPNPLPPEINVGEPFPLALTVQNISGAVVRFTDFSTTGENAEILDGASGQMGNVANDDQTNIAPLIMASAEGTVTVTVTLRYLDDLNQPREVVQTYETQAITPPPMEIPEETPPPVVETPAPPEDVIGRLLMGLLGLGS